jgi:hypothetical protein
MNPKGTKICLLVGLLILSCKSAGTGPVSYSNVADIQSALAVEPGNPFVGDGADLPPQGHSLFDELTASAEAPHILRQEILFPFEALLENLDALTLGKHVGSLLPRGRSLQRKAALQSPFRFPRVVIAFTDGPKPGAPILRDRLYLGYVEASRQLEIISYNEEAGRFEFQIVQNYGPGLTPTVAYAPRALCVSCHQNQAPMFSNNPWAETNGGSSFLGKRLVEAHPGSSSYMTVPLANGAASFEQVAALDESVERANLLSIINRLWIDACGRDEQGAPVCRARVMELALGAKVGICRKDRPFDRRFCNIVWHDNALAEEMEAEIRQHWYHYWPTGMKIPSPKVVSRSVENELLLNGPDTATDKEFSATAPRQPIGLLSPALQNNTSNLERLVKGLLFFMLDRDLDREDLLTAAGGDISRLALALQELARGTGTMAQRSLSAEPFQRGRFLRELRSILDGGERQLEVKVPLWKPVLAHELLAPAEVKSAALHPVLKRFVDHCGRCHIKAIPWLGGDDGIPGWDKLSQVSERVLIRLNWEAQGSHAETMPPVNSLEYRYLREHPEVRAFMLKAVETCHHKDLDSCAKGLAHQ